MSERAAEALEVVDAEHMMSLVAEMAFEAKAAAERAYATGDEQADEHEGKRARLEHAAPAADGEAEGGGADDERDAE